MWLITATLTVAFLAQAGFADVPDPCDETSVEFYELERDNGVTAALARDWERHERVWIVVMPCPDSTAQLRALFETEMDARRAKPMFMRQMRPDAEREPSHDLVDYNMLAAVLSQDYGPRCICDLGKG